MERYIGRDPKGPQHGVRVDTSSFWFLNAWLNWLNYELPFQSHAHFLLLVFVETNHVMKLPGTSTSHLSRKTSHTALRWWHMP